MAVAVKYQTGLSKAVFQPVYPKSNGALALGCTKEFIFFLREHS
jgi:hypothetical protein